MDGRRIEEVQVWEGLLHPLRRLPRVVVRDLVVDVVHHVRRADAVLYPVKHRAVGAVHGHEGALCPRPVAAVEVRHVHVRVLQPRDQHQPRVRDDEGQAVEEHGRLPAGEGAPRRKAPRHGDHADVAPVHLVRELAREKRVAPLYPLLGVEMARAAPHRPTGFACDEVCRPAEDEVRQHALECKLQLRPIGE